MKIYRKISSLLLSLALGALLGLSACTQNLDAHFERVGDLNIPRINHTATLLRDGRVLIAGGTTNCSALSNNAITYEKDCRGPLKSLEIYDPKTRRFSWVGKLNESHEMPNAPLLPDGRVVFIGAPGEHAEIFNPATNEVTLSGKLINLRKDHTVTLLNTGKILVTGGDFPSPPNGFVDKTAQTAEIFDPQIGEFKKIGNMNYGHGNHLAIALPNGKVFITGGRKPYGQYKDEPIELFDPQTNSFTESILNLSCRPYNKSILLNNTRILLLCRPKGLPPSPIPARIIDLRRETMFQSHTLKMQLDGTRLAPLSDNSIILLGGSAGLFIFSDVFIYDYDSDSLIRGPNIPEKKVGFSATRLLDGSILVSGGHVSLETYKASSHLFIPNRRNK